MPTIAEVASAEPRGKLELPGKSLVPLFAGRPMVGRYLFFEHEGNRAVTDGRWKLVALRNRSWELYDMEVDRTELRDLAAVEPEQVAQLSRNWDQWANANHVTPLPNDYHVPYLLAE